MDIQRDEQSINILMKVNGTDENFDPCNMAYLELTKEEILGWLELKKIFEGIPPHLGATSMQTYNEPNWIEEIPEELEELYEELMDSEHFGITQLPADFLSEHNCRTDGGGAALDKFGINFYSYFKHTDVRISTWSLSWDFLIECLVKCDPQSVQFIKEDTRTDDKQKDT